MNKLLILFCISLPCYSGINEKVVTQDISNEVIEAVADIGGSSFTRVIYNYDKTCVINTLICTCSKRTGYDAVNVSCEFYEALKKKVNSGK